MKKDPSRTYQELADENSFLKQRIQLLEQAEVALRESDAFSQSLIRYMHEVVIIISWEGNILFANEAAAKLVDIASPEELSGRNMVEFLHSDSLNKALGDSQTVKAGIEGFISEYRLCTTNNREVWVESIGGKIVFRGEEANMVCLHNITDRKRAEEKLKASEAKYSFLTEKMNDVIWTTDMNLDIAYVSPSIEKVLGYSPEEHISRDINEQVPPSSISLIQDVIARELTLEKEGNADPERIINIELEYYHKYGGTRWFEHVISGIRNDQGTLIGVHGVGRDITDRKQTEKALRESEQRMRLALEGTDLGLWEIDLLNREVTYSDNWYKILGYGPEESHFDYEWWASQIHPESRPVFEKALLDYMSGRKKYLEWEYQIRDKQGEWQWVSALGVFTETGKAGFPVRMIGTHRNITERKRMEEDLLRAHKLESLGILAGGIAHDFNNMMAIVQGYIDLALLDLPPNHVSRRQLLIAMKSVEQTKDLTSRLITFSRGGGPVREIFDIAELIRNEVHRMLKGTDVRIKFDFLEKEWPVEADKLQMKQVFNNLTTNALEAMPEGGNLAIQLEKALISAGEVIGLKEGSYLKIIFTDEGIGIPEEHLSKVFDPYFTTKGMGARKGLGLGLSVCYSVLSKHIGQITVKSQPGKGTSFVLYLPSIPDMAEEKEVMNVLSPGTVRVLIMDDETNIRVIERAYLERMGYEVTDVKDGQEAIDSYLKGLQAGAPFDLVMLDLTVRQGMGGQLAMERLLKIDPSVRAIIASGYVDDPVIENYTDYGFQGALKKPFTREEINILVENILQR